MSTKLDSLSCLSAETAMKGAIDFLVPAGAPKPKWTNDQVDALLAAIRTELHTVLPQALEDARAALNAPSMGAYAGPTFMASMRLAGIAAAKKWSAS